MGTILVRNLDDDVIARLKLKAEQRGMSLEGFVRERLSESARLTREEVVELARKIRAGQRPNVTRAEDLIREARDGDERW